MGSAKAARGINRLSDKDIKLFISQTKAGNAPTKKLSDGGGIYLAITPAGTAAWRFRYRFNKLEQLCSLGTYPQGKRRKSDATREAARAERDRLKLILTSGRDPVVERRIARARAVTATGNTFAAVAEAWLHKMQDDWKSEVHRKNARASLARDVTPYIGQHPIAEVTVSMILHVIKRVDRRGSHINARKILRRITSLFRYAQALDLCTTNPAALVPELLSKPRKAKSRPAVRKWAGLGDILRRADAAPLSRAVWLAHRVCAFTATRIGSVVIAEWPEFDLDSDAPTWVIPRAHMKEKDRDFDHVVALSPPIAADLRAMRAASGGKGFVFASEAENKNHPYITREAVEKAYRVTLALDAVHSPHGWRSAMSTLASDEGFNREVVELALDHEPRSAVIRSYDHGTREVSRHDLMNWWGKKLSEAQHGASVTPISSAGKKKRA